MLILFKLLQQNGLYIKNKNKKKLSPEFAACQTVLVYNKDYCDFDITGKEVFLFGVLVSMKLFCSDGPYHFVLMDHILPETISLFCFWSLFSNKKIWLTFTVSTVQ